MAIIVCSDTSKSWKRPFDGKNTSDIDASIIPDHMMLQATELGLGSVWICYFTFIPYYSSHTQNWHCIPVSMPCHPQHT